MSASLLALIAVLAAPSRAGVLAYDAGPADGAVFSGDGYHVARLESAGREDRWVVDGAPRVRAWPGTLPGAGVLSFDGSKLLHLTVVSEEGRRLGVAAAVNGRRVGKPYAEIQSLTLSPSGRAAAYAAKTAKGWAIVSSHKGAGPAFPEPPTRLTVTDKGLAYLAQWQDRTWLYRDHKPVRELGGDAAISPDLRRVGAVVRDRAAGQAFVEVDGKRYGPYADATVPVFSPNGAHWGFMATSIGGPPQGYDALIADGRPVRGAVCSDCTVVVDDAGRAFQDVLLVAISEQGQMHSFYLDGKELRQGGRPPKLGLLPGGAHFVYPMLTPRGVGVGFDGRVLEYDVPLPLPNAPVAFDGAEEYHYWTLDGNLHLVCGTTDGSDPALSRCARWAGGAFTPVR